MTAFTLVLTALFAERKASEEGLRESEERLRLAQLKTGVGIWDWDVRTGKLDLDTAARGDLRSPARQCDVLCRFPRSRASR